MIALNFKSNNLISNNQETQITILNNTPPVKILLTCFSLEAINNLLRLNRNTKPIVCTIAYIYPYSPNISGPTILAIIGNNKKWNNKDNPLPIAIIDMFLNTLASFSLIKRYF